VRSRHWERSGRRCRSGIGILNGISRAVIGTVSGYEDGESVSGNRDCGISFGWERSVGRDIMVRIQSVVCGVEFIPLDPTRRPRSRQLFEAHGSAPFRVDRPSIFPIFELQYQWIS
jgi:hypothetical protein